MTTPERLVELAEAFGEKAESWRKIGKVDPDERWREHADWWADTAAALRELQALRERRTAARDHLDSINLADPYPDEWERVRDAYVALFEEKPWEEGLDDE